jgi:HEAT repeat protein
VVSSWEAGLLLTLVAVAAMLVVALLLCNWRHGQQAEDARRLVRTLERMVPRWVGQGPSATEIDWLTHLSEADRQVLLGFCIGMPPRLDRDATERIRGVLCQSGLLEREVARLRRRSPAQRAEACRILGRLGQSDAIPVLLERLRDADSMVRRQAIGALADLGAVEALGPVAEAIDASADWSNLLAIMALARMGPASSRQVGALLAGSRSPGMTKALLQVTGQLGVAADPAAVRALASHPDPEIRVEAVRTLGNIAPDAESVTVCLAAMDDSEWPVRALAACSLGRLRDGRAIPRLERAMGDTAYWVRHHAAEAMAGLGEAGETALRRRLRDANPFVRDMAAQVLFMRILPAGGTA